MTGKRTPISKKLRFEVFKRDNFTCQYCGKMAPDVILEVDHINPVKEKGTSDIMNLITSCFDCNRGKGCKTLSDNQVIKQQQDQLKEINEKREQLKLMLKWKQELAKFDEEQVTIIDKMISEASENCLSATGRQNILKVIKRYGINEVIESTKASIDQYYKKENDMVKAVTYIPKICKCRETNKDNPWLYKTYYIKAIMKNRFGIYDNTRVMVCFHKLITTKEEYETICDFAKIARSWTNFWELINDYYEGDW